MGGPSGEGQKEKVSLTLGQKRYHQEALKAFFSDKRLHLVERKGSLHGPIWFAIHVETFGTCRLSNMDSLGPVRDWFY